MRAAKTAAGDPSEATERFNRVLGETAAALDESGVRYAFIGGIASSGLGRPRSTRDIDVFVRPEDAQGVLQSLARRGFRTERTDPAWLYKAYKDGVLVDVIFKSKGEIYLDAEMLGRTITAEYHGQRLRLVAPEDLVIIKAVAHSELTPGHWHDALALLTHATIDWGYLLRRARRAPRRVLSLLLYAQSADVWVPKAAIDELYRVIFGGELPAARPGPGPVAPVIPMPRGGDRAPPAGDPVARLRERLATDPRTNELDIQIEHDEGRLLLRGEVFTPERKDAVLRIAVETFPGFEIESQIRVLNVTSEPSTEEIK
jgi:predicted nucleotidyltransferase